jgi:signal transduction histidine kinase
MHANPSMEAEPQSERQPGAERAIVLALLQLAAIPKNDWEQSIQQILQIESDVLRLERVSYWSVREDPRLLYCEMGYVAGPRAFERGCILLESEHPLYFAEVSRAGVVEIVDAYNDPRMADLQDYVRARKISSLLDIPVWMRGSRVGVLCHEHTGSIRRWTDSDVDFAMAIAQTVAAALEAHARGNAEEERRRTAFLDQSSLWLTRARDVSAVAQQAMQRAVPELADSALLDVIEEGELVRVGIAHRTAEAQVLLEEITRSHPPRLDGPHPTARVMRLRQSVLIPDLSRARALIAGIGPEESRLVEKLGIRSAMAIPLLAGDHVLGAMQFHATDRQYDQSDLRFTEDFVERVAVALENARLHQKADAAIRARDEFIALAAHELHGPLTSLQLSAESLATSVTSTPETSAKMSNTVVRQTQRLNRLVDHMLDASRIMTKRLSLTVRPMDLSKLVQEIADSFAERCERAGSVLEQHIEPRVRGCWDADRLAQVISNLLDNAIKFGAGKPIEISLRSEGAEAVLSVSDHGIGIPSKWIGDLFDPFVRAVSPRNFGGLGLGLFMAKAIVDAHGGEIEVSSRPDEGSTFKVRLGQGLVPDRDGDPA